MGARENRQKEIERVYLERFLVLSGRDEHIEPSEHPDFILTGPQGRVGVEITQLFKRETLVSSRARKKGSAAKRDEKLREEFLSALARQYYLASGRPLRIQATLPESPSALAIPDIARDLKSLRESLELWAVADIREEYNGRGFHLNVRALPDDFPTYSHWICVNDSAGWVGFIDPGLLVEKVKSKAAKLSEYRKAADRVLLLLVADRRKNSGKFELDSSFRLEDSHGFDEVHVLLHPLSVCRIG